MTPPRPWPSTCRAAARTGRRGPSLSTPPATAAAPAAGPARPSARPGPSTPPPPKRPTGSGVSPAPPASPSAPPGPAPFGALPTGWPGRALKRSALPAGSRSPFSGNCWPVWAAGIDCAFAGGEELDRLSRPSSAGRALTPLRPAQRDTAAALSPVAALGPADLMSGGRSPRLAQRGTAAAFSPAAASDPLTWCREGAHSAPHRGARLPPFFQRLLSNPPTWCREV